MSCHEHIRIDGNHMSRLIFCRVCHTFRAGRYGLFCRRPNLPDPSVARWLRCDGRLVGARRSVRSMRPPGGSGRQGIAGALFRNHLRLVIGIDGRMSCLLDNPLRPARPREVATGTSPISVPRMHGGGGPRQVSTSAWVASVQTLQQTLEPVNTDGNC